MVRYQGISISDRIAIGTIFFYQKENPASYRQLTADPEAQIARFEAACEAALAELDNLATEAEKRAGEEEAAVFKGHRMLVRDPVLRDYILDTIRTQHVSASYAVELAEAHFVQMLFDTDDAHLREIVVDVKDVTGRLLRLLGEESEAKGPVAPSVLAAEELTPSDTLRLGQENLLALVVREGSVASHTAILARSLGIPALFGVEVREEWNGHPAVLDGEAGELLLDPDEDILTRMREKQRRIEERSSRREALRGEPSETRSGKKIALYANIGDLRDMEAVAANDAEGIGLFRTEFLFLSRRTVSSEEEQAAIYRTVVEEMGGKRVVIRTFDLGADKQLSDADPIDGQDISRDVRGKIPGARRGIRFCLEQPERFLAQLRAILRASAYGEAAVLFPMISSPEELHACRILLEQAGTELREEGKSFRNIEAGIMIETPEAVAAASELAKEADFFSIGTNDLSSALLGRDRLDAGFDARRAAADPAVCAAIRTTVEAAHAAGIRVGICGETAADPAMTGTLVQMGVDSLSVAPGEVLSVREAIRNLP